jgi:hypothetical protein
MPLTLRGIQRTLLGLAVVAAFVTMPDQLLAFGPTNR